MSATQTNLAPGTSQAVELVQIAEIRSVALSEGAPCMELVDGRFILSTLNDVALNIVVLPNEFLHALQVGVIEELRDW